MATEELWTEINQISHGVENQKRVRSIGKEELEVSTKEEKIDKRNTTSQGLEL